MEDLVKSNVWAYLFAAITLLLLGIFITSYTSTWSGPILKLKERRRVLSRILLILAFLLSAFITYELAKWGQVEDKDAISKNGSTDTLEQIKRTPVDSVVTSNYSTKRHKKEQISKNEKPQKEVSQKVTTPESSADTISFQNERTVEITKPKFEVIIKEFDIETTYKTDYEFLAEDSVIFDASEYIYFGYFVQNLGPDGSSSPLLKGLSFFPQFNHGALLFKPAKKNWIFVGSHRSGSMTFTGKGEFIVNDNDPSNNSGNFHCVVRIYRKS